MSFYDLNLNITMHNIYPIPPYLLFKCCIIYIAIVGFIVTCIIILLVAVAFLKKNCRSLDLTALVLFGIFREHSPAIFLRPQNIIKHALYGYFGPLFPRNIWISDQNRTHVPRYLLVLKFAYFATVAPLIFLYENTK